MSNRIKIPKEAVGPAATVILGARSITKEQLLVLKCLGKVTCEFFDWTYVPFSYITKRTRQPRKAVRRHCRALKRKGLAQYARGLFNEDGEVCGAGYSITHEGRAVLRYKACKKTKSKAKK